MIFLFCFLIKTTIQKSVYKEHRHRFNSKFEFIACESLIWTSTIERCFYNDYKQNQRNFGNEVAYICNDIIFFFDLFVSNDDPNSFIWYSIFNSTFISDWYNNRQKKNVVQCASSWIIDLFIITSCNIKSFYIITVVYWVEQMKLGQIRNISLLYFHEMFLCIFVRVVSVWDLRLNNLINGIVFRLLMCSYLSHRKNRFYCS